MNYLNLRYKPQNDIVCKFFLEPNNISMIQAANHVAGESSIGTWTKVSMNKRISDMRARIFSIEKNHVKIAYPAMLFEPGNMPQILSSVAGNIFGMRFVKNLRLEDISFPKSLAKSFLGPRYGISGVRKALKIKNRPLVGTIVKPKIGLATKQHARVAFDAWVGGIDIVKDDENLTSQNFNTFKKRIIETQKMRRKAEKITGESKAYMPNVTAETNDMIKRARFVKKSGGRYAMIDIITCGWSALQTLRKENTGLIIHAHRAGHAAFDRYKKHGISMRVIAKISRLIGVDQIHIGTAHIGKMVETRSEAIELQKALVEPLYNIKQVFPVASGGLHPGSIPKLLRVFGNNVIMQFGGGVHGHPGGTRPGAMAARQALEASMQSVSLKEYAKTRKELRQALRKWA